MNLGLKGFYPVCVPAWILSCLYSSRSKERNRISERSFHFIIRTEGPVSTVLVDCIDEKKGEMAFFVDTSFRQAKIAIGSRGASRWECFLPPFHFFRHPSSIEIYSSFYYDDKSGGR